GGGHRPANPLPQPLRNVLAALCEGLHADDQQPLQRATLRGRLAGQVDGRWSARLGGRRDRHCIRAAIYPKVVKQRKRRCCARSSTDVIEQGRSRDFRCWHISCDALAALKVRYGVSSSTATYLGERPELAHLSRCRIFR